MVPVWTTFELSGNRLFLALPVGLYRFEAVIGARFGIFLLSVSFFIYSSQVERRKVAAGISFV